MREIVDNFDLIAKKLFEQPLKEDEFYYLQILVRGKDGNSVRQNSRHRLVKEYTIKSAEQFYKDKQEIIALCRIDNARAYIHPTKRNSKEVANEFIQDALRKYVSQNYNGMKSLYPTACGKSYVNGDKKYIVDLDDMAPTDKKYQEIVKTIYGLRGKGGENSDKVFMTVPTKSGYHLVTYPFDIKSFQKRFPEIAVHNNNPTLLYYEWESLESGKES